MQSIETDQELLIEVLNLKKAALLLRAINHKLRQALMQLIHKKPGITVTEIYVIMRMEQSVASQHLAILRRAGFLKTKRDGKFIRYYINYDQLAHVHKQAESLLDKS